MPYFWFVHLWRKFLSKPLPDMQEQFSTKGNMNYYKLQCIIKLNYVININNMQMHKIIKITWRIPHHLISFMSTPYVNLSGACEKPPSQHIEGMST